MKNMKKLFCLLFTFSLLLGSTLPASAETGTTYFWPRYCMKITTATVDAKKKPLYGTQTQHKKGYSTTISVEKSKSKSLAISESITGQFSTPFESLSAELGLSQEETQTVSVGVSYTISASKDTGLYRITTVFPCKKESVKVYQNNNNSTALVYSNNISYAPQSNDSYYTLERYDD